MAETEAKFPSADRHQAELRAVAELERLPGVVSAAVWLDADGALRDARLHTMPGAAPSIMGNAAARVFQAIGIPHDPRTLRILPVALPDDLGAAAGDVIGGRFLLLQDFTLARAGAHISCRVQLVRDASPVFGEARELDTAAGRLRAAASATLRAAEESAANLALGLEGAAVATIFGRSYAVVSVEGSIGRRTATLSGIVTIEGNRSPEEAVCLATLRAIDRWIAI